MTYIFCDEQTYLLAWAGKWVRDGTWGRKAAMQAMDTDQRDIAEKMKELLRG